MMKIIFSVLLSLALLIFISAGPVPEEFKEAQPEIRKTCLGISGVDEELVIRAAAGDITEDPKLKCYFKCVFDQFRLISKKGINYEALLSLSPPSMKENAIVMVEKCRDLEGSDQCDLSYKVTKCFYETKPDTYFIM